MPTYPIVDAHVHLWDPGRFSYPWLEEIPTLNHSFLLEDFDAQRCAIDVESLVFVQCETDPAQGLDEAHWIASLAVEDSRIKAMVPFAPLEIGNAAESHLVQLASLPMVKGVRRLIQSESNPDFCLQPDFIKGIQLLDKYSLSFDICISHNQLTNTIEMVRQCPHVFFILDHIAKPDIKAGLFEPWKSQLRQLSQLPNVCCKISGMVTEADHDNWTREDLKPYIEHVIECFGWERVMYGGDWPVATLATDYPRWVDALEWALDGCSDEELHGFFHDNAARFYRM
jgi:predicted TIM-barrel fold metal-dependent hydrolase